MSIYQPYTYRIAWSTINKHYYGVRYAKGCNPKDFWKSYFTSSKLVREFRELYGEPDIIEIRKTFDDPQKAREWEEKVLRKLDVIKNEKWLNRNISGKNFYCVDSDHYKSLDYRKIMSEAQLKISDQISKRQTGINNSFYGKNTLKNQIKEEEKNFKVLKNLKKLKKKYEEIKIHQKD